MQYEHTTIDIESANISSNPLISHNESSESPIETYSLLSSNHKNSFAVAQKDTSKEDPSSSQTVTVIEDHVHSSNPFQKLSPSKKTDDKSSFLLISQNDDYSPSQDYNNSVCCFCCSQYFLFGFYLFNYLLLYISPTTYSIGRQMIGLKAFLTSIILFVCGMVC